MSFRFVGLDGAQKVSRNYSTRSGATILSSDETSTERLVEVVRGLLDRVQELEKNQSPSWIEFYVVFNTTTNKLYLPHHFKSAVRFWPTYVFSGDISTITVDTAQTTNDVLALTTSGSGTMIIRVEQSQFTTIV